MSITRRQPAALTLLIGFLSVPTGARAHFGDPAYMDLPYMDGFEPAAAKSDAAAAPAGAAAAGDTLGPMLAHIVSRAASLTSARGDTLLPPGTTLDRHEFDGRVLSVWLTVPAKSGFETLDELRVASIDHALALPLAADPGFGGISIQLRVGSGAYRSIGEYIPRPDPSFAKDVPVYEEPPSATRTLREHLVPKAQEAPQTLGLGGPVANADGQPSGALSGVVVFINAGHGWTAGTSSWYLQRPLLLNMNEDYGNLEQLNLLAQYLYNAGAVVVPFRPIGYQPVEIVLDNDDPGVTWTGSWNNSVATAEYYENGVTVSGIPYRYATASATQTATARYTPNIPTADFYPVYCWTRDGTDRVTQTYRVVHSGGTASIQIDHRRVGKGWIWLGTYYFEAGTGGYVEITNQSPNSGVVIADAIRFGHGIGDIVRPGPGTVSGYPRDEECARYWAHSELGNHAVGFSAASIWDSSSNDDNDNVSTAARWAAVMNRQDINNDRWRRVYMEYHSNAANTQARGVVSLYNVTNGTTNQLAYATITGEKLEADMVALNGQFEYNWGQRNPNTYHASFAYGAISGTSTGNEFDATIMEVAFHDNPQDAALLRDVRVRNAIARSTMHGIIKFLNTLPGSQVPLIYPPDTPSAVRATHDGNGQIVLSWTPPIGQEPYGGPATGYKIYRSSNGYGFGQAIDVGNVTTATISSIGSNVTTYLRVAAYNAGGESMPSETLAVRRPSSGPTQVLIVNGFDRVSRHLNPIQNIGYGPLERQIPRRVNSFDYVVQHAMVLDAAGLTFDSTSNEAVIDGTVSLSNYAAVVWILGRESSADKTFDPAEQTLVSAYLNAGGRLFASGTDIGFDLVSQGGGASFFENTLKASYVGDDAGTFTAVGSGGCLAGLGTISFSTAGGAPYVAAFPDRIAPRPGAVGILSYSGGSGGTAGIQYDSSLYRVVLLGFPFECINNAQTRAEVMGRVMNFLIPGGGSRCFAAALTSFEGYSPGSQVMFRSPRLSNTAVNLAVSPDVAMVTSDVAAQDGTQSCKVQWQFVDADPSRWLRLTTFQTANMPNPTIDLRRAVRLRVRFEQPAGASLRIAMGVRETGVDVPIGSNGGITGDVEWVGVSDVVNGAPQGITITAQPGVWQAVTFLPNPDQVRAYTGDGVLSAPNDRGVLEHLAFTIVDHVGPFTLYLDNIEQPCPPRADFDGDGDVDMVDFAHLQACYASSSMMVPECLDANLDGDSDVDALDFQIFNQCLQGAGLIADPNCAN